MFSSDVDLLQMEEEDARLASTMDPGMTGSSQAAAGAGPGKARSREDRLLAPFSDAQLAGRVLRIVANLTGDIPLTHAELRAVLETKLGVC